MNRSIEWSREALDDFKQQIAFIARDAPRAAVSVARRVDVAAELLTGPVRTRVGRVGGTFEMPVRGLPYILAYTITEEGAGETVTIVRVIHAARDWRPMTWPR